MSAPATLPACLIRHARERPRDVALRKKDLGRWEEWTWADYEQRVARVAAGLRSCGIEPGDRIAIQSENRPEWLVADIAAQAIGAIVVGVYPTSPAAELEYLMRHSGSKLLIAEDEEQVDKALAVRSDLPDLTDVFVVDTRGVRDGDVRRWEELEDAEALDLAAAAAELDPEETAIIVYTSGTTGPPKGAMLSHANMLYAARIFRDAYGTTPGDEVLSYLPLCHIAERLFSVLGALEAGYVVNFGAGGESFPTDMREVQPTVFLGVPRVWEKMLATVEVRMADASRAKRLLWRAALARGGFIGHLLAFRALREKLGLVRVRAAISGAAPIAPQVLEFFARIGVHVREGYGQTEGTAVATATPEGGIRIGTVGTALPDVELRIADDGEILVRSPGVFLRLLPRRGGDGAHDRRRRLAAHGRRRRARRRRLPDDHRPQEGHHHHGGREEHLAVGDREQAQGLALRARGDRDRRQAQVPDRADRDRARHGGGLGRPPRRDVHDLRRPGVEGAGARARSANGSSASTPSSRRSSRSSASRCCGRSSTTRTAS